MIIFGIILLVLGYWLLPVLLHAPPELCQAGVILGWVFVVIGICVLIFSLVRGSPLGGRYWY